MRKFVIFFFALLWVSALAAEEFLLKDGTKIVGKTVGVKDDSFEVETKHGTLRIARSEIVTITFAETQAERGTEEAAADQSQPMGETLEGGSYVNRTGRFKLTVPAEWKLPSNPENTPGRLTQLSWMNGGCIFQVHEKALEGSIEDYVNLWMVGMKAQGYQELERSTIPIEGAQRPLRVGTMRQNNVSLRVTIAFLPRDGKVLMLLAVLPDEMFESGRMDEMEKTLKGVMQSFTTVKTDPSSD